MTTIQSDTHQMKSKGHATSTELANILIVDDDSLVLKALEKTLENKAYKIVACSSGKEAHEHLRNQKFAVIVCDQKMPDVSGIEVLKDAFETQPNAVRILLTGYGDLETVIQAINVGQASQFLFKPWDNEFLKQTVAESVSKYRLLVENEHLHQLTKTQNTALSQAHETLKRDLTLGARIQEVMLMGVPPTEHPNLDIAAKTLPSKEIDGDFYDFFNIDDSTFDLALGDVMGKGLPAALVGTAVKTQLMRYAKPIIAYHDYSKDGCWRQNHLTPKEILLSVHNEVNKHLCHLEFFVSLLYARFNFKNHSLEFIDCGSAKPLFYKASEGKTYEIKGENFPLGVLETESYNKVDCPFANEDCFVFYSDGVTEAQSEDGELFGLQRLHTLVEQHAYQPAQKLLDVILEAIVDFSGKDSFQDDVTIVIVKIKNMNPIRSLSGKNMTFASELSQAKAVRQFTDRICMEAPGDHERLSNELQLINDEIFSNIVKHGYKGVKDGEIEIFGKLTNEGVLFQILDKGESFDPSEVAEPTLTGKRSNGFGWFLIKELTDRITYVPKDSEEGWNSLTLFKNYLLDEGKMEISHSAQKNILIVTLEGEHLDAKEANVFKDQINRICQEEDIFQVVFDLHRLKFIDSSGLGAFLSILKQLKTKEGDLKLASMSQTIQTMFELVCMHKIFEIFNSTDDALQSFDS